LSFSFPLRVLGFLSFALFALDAEPAFLVPRDVTEGFGCNIHFLDPAPGEMKMFAAAGFRWVRGDLHWDQMEPAKGKYDFSRHDKLFKELDPHHIRALMTFNGTNPLYDQGQSPCTKEGRQAFARWAHAIVERYKGRGIVWEMYNEPNITYWKPQSNIRDYIALALEVGKMIQADFPDEIYVGPACCGVDLPFLEACFRADLLRYWSAVVVHPYRTEPSETVAPDYRELRRLISKYAPPGRKPPIVSGEWGFASPRGGFTEEQQAKMFLRMWLVNLAQEIPLMISYNWRDDGIVPDDLEQNYGFVRYNYLYDHDPVYDPKPAYFTARTFTERLKGFEFNKRLMLEKPDDYLLLFKRGEELLLVAWTASPRTSEVEIPASSGVFQVFSHLGKKLEDLKSGKLVLTDAPVYLVPQGENELLRLAAHWERIPLQMSNSAPQWNVALKNPLSHPILFSVNGSADTRLAPGETGEVSTTWSGDWSAPEIPFRVDMKVKDVGRLAQETSVFIETPLDAKISPAGDSFQISVESPSGNGFEGKAVMKEVEGMESETREMPFSLQEGATASQWSWPSYHIKEANYGFSLELQTQEGRSVLKLPMQRFCAWTNFCDSAAHQLLAEGNAKVSSEQTLTVEDTAHVLQGSSKALRMVYRIDSGWKYLRLASRAGHIQKMPGTPKWLGVWIDGDGENGVPRVRFADSTGQIFQAEGDPVSWKGWRYVRFPLDGHGGCWGGAEDGKIHYPIQWDSFVFEKGTAQKAEGNIGLSSVTLIY